MIDVDRGEPEPERRRTKERGKRQKKRKVEVYDSSFPELTCVMRGGGLLSSTEGLSVAVFLLRVLERGATGDAARGRGNDSDVNKAH